MLRSKIVTDASVLITFNIAVMLNGRVSDALAAKTPWHAVSPFSNVLVRHVGGPVQGVPLRKFPQLQPDRGQHPHPGWRGGRAALPEQQEQGEASNQRRVHAQPAGRGRRGGLIAEKEEMC